MNPDKYEEMLKAYNEPDLHKFYSFPPNLINKFYNMRYPH